jgi:Ser/Thr protein kinase RdoA (MazF antagonist)
MTIGARIAEGREAEVFEWEEGAVLKLYRPGYLGHVPEAAALSAIERGGGPAPRVIDAVEIDGRHGLVLERLEGRDMLSILEHRPWQMLDLARSLAEAHALIHGIEAPPDLPELKKLLVARIEAGVEDRSLRDFALRVLEPLPEGNRLCHGDFHPGNVLISELRVSVIDWSNATRGVPEADFARTALLIGHGDPPPGTSGLLRALVRIGRSLFAGSYARNYRRRAPRLLQNVRSWEIAHAAARLAEGIEAETQMLISFLKAERARG